MAAYSEPAMAIRMSAVSVQRRTLTDVAQLRQNGTGYRKKRYPHRPDTKSNARTRPQELALAHEILTIDPASWDRHRGQIFGKISSRE
jgi:hypothetical protein